MKEPRQGADGDGQTVEQRVVRVARLRVEEVVGGDIRHLDRVGHAQWQKVDEREAFEPYGRGYADPQQHCCPPLRQHLASLRRCPVLEPLAVKEEDDERLEREEVEKVRDASKAAGTGAERLDRSMHANAPVHGQVTERVGVETRMRGLLMVFVIVPAPPMLRSDPVMQEANPTE